MLRRMKHIYGKLYSMYSKTSCLNNYFAWRLFFFYLNNEKTTWNISDFISSFVTLPGKCIICSLLYIKLEINHKSPHVHHWLKLRKALKWKELINIVIILVTGSACKFSSMHYDWRVFIFCFVQIAVDMML